MLNLHTNNHSRTHPYIKVRVKRENTTRTIFAFYVLFVYHCIIGKGVVCGVPIEMSEDMVRRTYIDEAAKDIKPTIRPSLYSVEFVPIEHNGTLKGMRYCCRCRNIVMLIPCRFIFP